MSEEEQKKPEEILEEQNVIWNVVPTIPSLKPSKKAGTADS